MVITYRKNKKGGKWQVTKSDPGYPKVATTSFKVVLDEKKDKTLVDLWRKQIMDPRRILHLFLKGDSHAICGLKRDPRRKPSPGAPLCAHCKAYAEMVRRSLGKVLKENKGKLVDVDPRCEDGVVRLVWEKRSAWEKRKGRKQ